MKLRLCSGLGVVGSVFAGFFGGWDTGITTLIIFMILDYISGLVIAGVFHKSTKTESGTLDSKTCWEGLCKKCMTLVYVLVAHRVDLTLGTNYIRDMVVIGFAVNELISLTENAGLMGIPLPDALYSAIDVLQKKGGKGNE